MIIKKNFPYAVDVLKNAALCNTTRDEMQRFLLRLENSFSGERLFAPEQTNIKKFFSRVG